MFSENSNHQIHVVLQHARSFSSSQADASSSSLITSVWPLLLQKTLYSFYVCNYRNYGGCLTPIVLYQQTSLYLVLPSTLQFLAYWFSPNFVVQAVLKLWPCLNHLLPCVNHLLCLFVNHLWLP